MGQNVQLIITDKHLYGSLNMSTLTDYRFNLINTWCKAAVFFLQSFMQKLV